MDTPEINVEVVQPETQETVVDVVDTALEIAKELDDARKEGEAKAEQSDEVIEFTLQMVFGEINALGARLNELFGLVEVLVDEVATLSALQVAEVVVDNTPTKTEEIVDVATEVLEETPPVAEEVPVTPEAPAPKKKTRKWL